ncbi:GtrA family protein [Weissella ceti]|nr:GtrA family protein [Weissella ceti]
MTTIISLASYALFLSVWNVNYQISNVLSWIISVTFAFFVNKYFVFHSKQSDLKTLLIEGMNFYGARLGTLFMEMFVLWVGVSVLQGDAYLWKLIVQVLILVANYVASKFIFKNKAA